MSTIGPGVQKDSFQTDSFQWNDPPSAPTVNTPVAATAYSATIGLDATVTDGASVDSVTDTVLASFEYDKSDNNWVAISTGSVVASGSRSVYQWNVSALMPGFLYRVRALARDVWSQDSAYTTTASFIIGPGFASIYADSNTSLYAPTNTTTSYGADTQTTTYEGVKT